MSELILESSATAAWYRLVTEAASATASTLDEDRESYLVFLLMRYLRRPELVRAVMAAEFLDGLGLPGRRRREAMQAVGDQCLIFTGLFPEQADRRRVRLSYFVDLGQCAYDEVAISVDRANAGLFHALASTFVRLADVLRAVRQRPHSPLMTALEAAQRWDETGSELARDCLAEYTTATPLPASSQRH